jgi:DNA-binding NarL/FixJ family response regulator
MMDKAIKKMRRSRRAQTDKPGSSENTTPRKVDERMILIVLKLRRKGCYIREIAAHVGLAHGTVHNIIKKYGSDPQMQSLVTEGTQMELTDYFLIRPEDPLDEE